MLIARLIRKWQLARLKKRGLQIANDCRLFSSPRCFGSEPYLVSVGSQVTISGNVNFITHDGATSVFREREGMQDVIKYGRITVRERSFIGHGATILPGVQIGPASVIAAGAVVHQDVPPGEVWGGVPARRICTVEEYAAKAAERSPDYDRTNYRTAKKAELLRLFPYPW